MRISAGCSAIDSLLDGGYEKDAITTVYGPGGSGKTNLCMLCAISLAKEGKKVVYIDTDGSFSVERFKQITPDFEKILDSIIFFTPTTFEEQKKCFEKLKALDNISLVVIDSIGMLYRIEISRTENIQNVNCDLGLQLSYLSEITRKKNIPILITNQVYSDFENKDKVKMVGGDILRYSSKCLIELQKFHKGKRKAILKKHRSLPEDKEVMFEIIQEGIKEIKNL